MESRLTRITQHMAVLASVERHADETIDRRADVTHGIQLLVNDFCRHIPPLKQIAVQPAEIAVDIFARLDVLDPVDRSRLAVAKSFVTSCPLIFVISPTRSSHSGARCADVREVIPPAMRPRSI